MTTESAPKRKEIYTYQAPWLIYGMNWSVRADQRFRLAIGSFEEEYSNSVRIIQLDEEAHQFVDNGGFEHPYPTTKIMWIPDATGARRDLLATTGDYLRLWNVNDNKSVRLECLLNNNKNTEFCAPLTSFDWNEQDPNIIGTCSIDTTCTIWDISKMQVPHGDVLPQPPTAGRVQEGCRKGARRVQGESQVTKRALVLWGRRTNTVQACVCDPPPPHSLLLPSGENAADRA
uniref:Peroxin-7 n=1 Tax=Haptolina ericina TaxID=156174 RepID=A0A7S3AMF5_9EUKA